MNSPRAGAAVFHSINSNRERKKRSGWLVTEAAPAFRDRETTSAID